MNALQLVPTPPLLFAVRGLPTGASSSIDPKLQRRVLDTVRKIADAHCDTGDNSWSRRRRRRSSGKQ